MIWEIMQVFICTESYPQQWNCCWFWRYLCCRSSELVLVRVWWWGRRPSDCVTRRRIVQVPTIPGGVWRWPVVWTPPRAASAPIVMHGCRWHTGSNWASLPTPVRQQEVLNTQQNIKCMTRCDKSFFSPGANEMWCKWYAIKKKWWITFSSANGFVFLFHFCFV